MPDIILAEYAQIGSFVLATPGVLAQDLASLHRPAPLVTGTSEVPYGGTVAHAPWVGEKPVQIPLLIRGRFDEDGNPWPSSLEGLRGNLDAAAAAIAADARANPLVRHHLADGTVRQARVYDPRLDVEFTTPNDLAGTLAFTIPRGVMRDETPVVANSPDSALERTLTVPNPGTAQQLEAVITLTGSATSVKLTNTTYDPGGGTWLNFGGTFGAGVTIDTAVATAYRGGVDTGLVTHSGHPRWLPLAQAIDNDLTITPIGGTVDVTVTHYPAYL